MRTFDDIIPPSRRSNPSPPPLGGVPPEPGRPPSARSPRGRRFPYTIAVIALVVVAGSAATLIYFSRAKIEITPTVTSLPIEGSFTAGVSGDLPFALITTKKVATTSVSSSGTKESNSPASGNLTIYNTSAKSILLIATTRFATPAGLIFKVPKAVTVPGGSVEKPGSVTVQVVAALPGPTYDIGPSTFTLPGLAGSAEANVVTAKSSSAMTGGAAGPVPIVDPSIAQAALASFESSLAADLQSALKAQVPEGYVLLSGAATSSYRLLTPTSSSQEGKADLPIEGTVTGVAFPKSALAGVIASSSMQGGDVTLARDTTLSLTPTSGFPTSDADVFSFSLSGTADLVSKVDQGAIATAVAGKSRSEAEIALTNYPEVKHAILVLRPFWRQSFPEDPAAIAVVVDGTVTTVEASAP